MEDSVDAKGDTGKGMPAGVGAAGGVAPRQTASQFVSDEYNMKHKRRGKAIIFNHKTFDKHTGMNTRAGTDEDAKTLHALFGTMGFNVTVHNDFPAQKMKDTLAQVGKEDHSDSDCFACAILSHGEEGYVWGRDGSVKIEDLVQPFKGHECQTLAGKPKLFFIQACRGMKMDSGVEVADAKGVAAEEEMEYDDDDIQMRRIPSEADFLFAYSTVPGYYAWRNSTKGSWFIQALASVLRKEWERMDLMTMMTRVNKQVAYDFESNASGNMGGKKEIPCITSMLTKDVYFVRK